MFKNSDDVLKYIKDNDVKMVDVRFCDLPGVMQHFNIPVESVDESLFTDGQMFDGSSIAGCSPWWSRTASRSATMCRRRRCRRMLQTTICVPISTTRSEGIWK